MSAATSDATTGARKPKWPHAGAGQKPLLLAAILATVGSFLPWIETAFGTFGGLAGLGTWTLYAGVLGIGGSLVKRPWLAEASAVVFGVVAVVLPVVQLARMVPLGGFGDGWLPGVGLIIVLGSGLLSLYAAWVLHRRAASAF